MNHVSNNLSGSLFHTMLPPEMRELVFQHLPVGALINSAGLVCKDWRERASREGNRRPVVSFEDIQLDDKEAAEFINTQWREFETFVKAKEYPACKTSLILLKARNIFVACLNRAVEKCKTVNNSAGVPTSTPEASMRGVDLTLNMHLSITMESRFIWDIRKIEGVSIHSHEIKELFLRFIHKEGTLLSNIFNSQQNLIAEDLEFFTYLAAKEASLFTDEEIKKNIQLLVMFSVLGPSSLPYFECLKIFLTKFTEQHGVEKMVSLVASCLLENLEHPLNLGSADDAIKGAFITASKFMAEYQATHQIKE